MQRAISVIVPAYNVGPYVEECLDSLLQQTVPLEIIVVNDGSTDDTADRVRGIGSSPLHAIILIEQQNKGLSAARNTGLRRAQGEFVGFVDGDDWVEQETYSTLVAAARDLDAELVICNGEMIDHNTQATKPFHDDQRFRELASRYPTPFDPRAVPDVFRLDTCACKRLYRRSLLQRIDFRFAHGLLFEDILAHYQLLMSSGAILLLDRKLYNYRINHPGRITDKKDEHLLTVFEIMRLSERTLRANDASDEIWASFIWFQSWVLRWLASQVDVPHQGDFSKGVVSVGRQLPRRGILEFQRKFASDHMAQLTVALQMFGLKRTFLSLSTDTLSDRDRRILASATRLKTLAPFFGRLS